MRINLPEPCLLDDLPNVNPAPNFDDNGANWDEVDQAIC